MHAFSHILPYESRGYLDQVFSLTSWTHPQLMISGANETRIGWNVWPWRIGIPIHWQRPEVNMANQPRQCPSSHPLKCDRPFLIRIRTHQQKSAQFNLYWLADWLTDWNDMSQWVIDWLGRSFTSHNARWRLCEMTIKRTWGGLFVAPSPEAQDRRWQTIWKSQRQMCHFK